MLAFFTEAATAITAVLGEEAVYTVAASGATVVLRAVIERDVQAPISPMGELVQDRRTVITVRAADLTGHTPVLGDTLRCGVETWKVLALDQDDGYLIRLLVRGFPAVGRGTLRQGGNTATGELSQTGESPP